MPTRRELQALANELRHSTTRLLPLELAERVQHAIVRLEALCSAPPRDAADLEQPYRAGKKLLDECNELLRRP